jgi:hypothetical protein
MQSTRGGSHSPLLARYECAHISLSVVHVHSESACPSHNDPLTPHSRHSKLTLLAVATPRHAPHHNTPRHAVDRWSTSSPPSTPIRTCGQGTRRTHRTLRSRNTLCDIRTLKRPTRSRRSTRSSTRPRTFWCVVLCSPFQQPRDGHAAHAVVACRHRWGPPSPPPFPCLVPAVAAWESVCAFGCAPLFGAHVILEMCMQHTSSKTCSCGCVRLTRFCVGLLSTHIPCHNPQHKNLDTLLDRGEKLDDLVSKSEGLSSSVSNA